MCSDFVRGRYRIDGPKRDEGFYTAEASISILGMFEAQADCVSLTRALTLEDRSDYRYG